MHLPRRPSNLAVIASLLAVSALSLTIVATGGRGSGDVARSAGKYYVNGARPSSDANAATKEGCVQWSANRPDVHICGSIPDGWTPQPPPAFNAAICESAASVLAEKRDELERHYGNAPVVDPASCIVQRRQNGLDWFVVFNLVSASETGHEAVLVAFDDEGEQAPVVSLS